MYFFLLFSAEEDDKYELESVSDDEEEGDLGLESTHGGSGSSKEGGFAGFSGKGPRRNSRGDDEERETYSEVKYLHVFLSVWIRLLRSCF